MENKDVRWLQRFNNYKKALSGLREFIDKGGLNKLEQQGLIKAFEYTYELAWNTIKDFYEYQGETGLQGAKDCFRMAYNRGLTSAGELWMRMITDRNNTTHTYNEQTAKEIVNNIMEDYFGLFVELQDKLGEISSNESNG
jgi:nucleotidyltransferase substrate binding protein (TIGR01987 family)